MSGIPIHIRNHNDGGPIITNNNNDFYESGLIYKIIISGVLNLGKVRLLYCYH